MRACEWSPALPETCLLGTLERDLPEAVLPSPDLSPPDDLYCCCWYIKSNQTETAPYSLPQLHVAVSAECRRKSNDLARRLGGSFDIVQAYCMICCQSLRTRQAVLVISVLRHFKHSTHNCCSGRSYIVFTARGATHSSVLLLQVICPSLRDVEIS